MRVLILSANTGGGHNSAAAAIREELTARGIESETRDCLRYLSEKASEFISWGHSYVYKNLPGLFGKVYEFEGNHQTTWINDTIAMGVQRFYKAVKEEGFTHIICVHVFAAMLVTEAKHRYGYAVPFYFVATDYTCSPGVDTIEPAAWFTPDEALHEEFIACGVPAERLVATGIPIRRGFYQPPDQTAARRALHLPLTGKLVLLCCGSIGCGHINRMAPELEAVLPPDATLVIICGHNVRTYRKLRERVSWQTVVVGFTDRIAEYMAAADLCISKPGGLSTTELMAVGLPMVLLLAVPGCESRNLDYMLARGFAVGAENWTAAIQATDRLLHQPEQLEEMRAQLRAHPQPVAAERLVDYILQKS